jgi:hypothetical protein
MSAVIAQEHINVTVNSEELIGTTEYLKHTLHTYTSVAYTDVVITEFNCICKETVPKKAIFLSSMKFR